MKTFDIIKKIQKLIVLAEHPETPISEVTSARNHIDVLLKKYNLSVEDVLEEKISRREFRIKNTWEHMLINQIILNNVSTRKPFIAKYKRYKIVIADLTDAEYVNVSEAWNWHLKLFKKDMNSALNAFVAAYVAKHDLYSSLKDSNKPVSTLTFEEIERIRSAMRNLSNESYYKKLN